MAGGAKRWIEAGKGSDRATDLVRYVDGLKIRLSAPVPAKHAANPDSYREYLRREIDQHQRRIDYLRLAEPAKR